MRWLPDLVGTRRLFTALLVFGLLPQAGACHGQAPASVNDAPARTEAASLGATDSTFAHLVASLSEPGGYFDTDNLISNERSYLHVLGTMRALDVEGGAYIGVGPDQNFAYIAQIRPTVAFIIDIRRDNLLQHVFFKALFAQARNRIEYLSLLFGKPMPGDDDAWAEHTIDQLMADIDEAPAHPEAAEAARAAVRAQAASTSLPLSAADMATIGRIHDRFIQAGLDLRFSSHNRPSRSYYPSYRQLMLETDLTGRLGHYLAREADFQFLKTLQAQDRVIPIVGDLSGEHALAAIGRFLTERGEHVSAFYTSNIEFYMMRRGRFDRFVENVGKLPMNERSMIVRSYFNRFTSTHPQTVPGYASTQLLQPMESLVKEHERGGYQTYWDLINKHILNVR